MGKNENVKITHSGAFSQFSGGGGAIPHPAFSSQHLFLTGWTPGVLKKIPAPVLENTLI